MARQQVSLFLFGIISFSKRANVLSSSLSEAGKSLLLAGLLTESPARQSLPNNPELVRNRQRYQFLILQK